MAWNSPATPAGWRPPEEDREDRLAVLRIHLQEAGQDIRTPEDWARYLQTAARMPTETWPNILLISSRRPDATLVRGYEAWRAAGRQVNRDEKGIAIFSAAAQQDGNRYHSADEGQARSWRDADHVTYV